MAGVSTAARATSAGRAVWARCWSKPKRGRPASSISTPATLLDEIRDAGLRATASRVAVLDALRCAERPLSHADVVELLHGRGWDRATLYRNLLDLTEAGLLRKATLGDRVWRFEGADEAGHAVEAHPHFVCVGCGAVECLPGVTMTINPPKHVPRAVKGGRVEIQVRGLCDGCA